MHLNKKEMSKTIITKIKLTIELYLEHLSLLNKNKSRIKIFFLNDH